MKYHLIPPNVLFIDTLASRPTILRPYFEAQDSAVQRLPPTFPREIAPLRRRGQSLEGSGRVERPFCTRPCLAAAVRKGPMPACTTTTTTTDQIQGQTRNCSLLPDPRGTFWDAARPRSRGPASGHLSVGPCLGDVSICTSPIPVVVDSSVPRAFGVWPLWVLVRTGVASFPCRRPGEEGGEGSRERKHLALFGRAVVRRAR